MSNSRIMEEMKEFQEFLNDVRYNGFQTKDSYSGWDDEQVCLYLIGVAKDLIRGERSSVRFKNEERRKYLVSQRKKMESLLKECQDPVLKNLKMDWSDGVEEALRKGFEKIVKDLENVYHKNVEEDGGYEL